MKKLKIDKFVLAIIAVVLLAYIFPQFGSKSSSIPLDLIGSIGISLIFFFYGLKLKPEKLKIGLKNWKLHLLVQFSTFLIFPIIILAFYPFIESQDNKDIWLAFMFLAALPSTVSSSVVMVSMAKGNIPAAIFNATISGLIGIVVTPFWMGFFLKNNNSNYDLSSIYTKLLLEVLVPIILGLILQSYLGKLAEKHNKTLTLFDKSIILIIIYKSFASSFEEKVFNNINFKDLTVITVLIIILFLIIYKLIGFISTKLKFNQEDTITAQFCGTKKSLIHGTIFSKILFQNTATIGIILLPLMLFHAIQIFIISIIASKLSNREEF